MKLQDICLTKPIKNTKSHLDIFTFQQQNALPFCPALWHDELFLAKVQQGSCALIVDGVRHQLNVGDIILLPPFTVYALTSCNQLHLDCCFANLRSLQQNKNNLTYMSSANVDCIVRPDQEKYPQIQQALVQLYQDKNLDHMCLIDIQNILHWLHHRTPMQNVTADKHLFAIKNALNIVHSQTHQLVVGQLAEQCGYSEFYLMKLFKRYTGFSCVEYAINYKLTQIALQLLRTTEDFCKLAQKVGFSNISYCNRQFKRLFGLTPKEFRKLHQ